MALVSETTAVLVFLIALIAALHWLSQIKLLAFIFRYLPPVIWVYFLPMLSSNVGLIPQTHPLYDWVRTYLLPAALILMLLSANIPSLANLGPKAIVTMLSGTVGIAVGAVMAYTILHGWLPEESWRGVGALTASWIGGSANMVAVATSVGASDSMLGPLIVVDTVVGYGWMGVVIALSVFQDRVDRNNGVDRTLLDHLNRRMGELDAINRRPILLLDLLTILALGLGLGHTMVQVGGAMPPMGEVLNAFGWAIIFSTGCGVLLSFTRLSELDYAGASTIGTFFFYLLLATIGARADIAGIVDAPLFVLLGVLIIAVHATTLFFAGRIFKSPMFLMASASQANIGGPVTAPIVATVYQNALAPVGLLMAVMGNMMGTFVGLAVAQVCYWIGG